MAIEFISNCHSIGLIEKVCKDLVRKGAAQSIKDTRVGEFETERYIKDDSKKEEFHDKGFDVVVYRQYLVNIKTAPVYLPWIADIRFWYDKRSNRAGIKLSAESLQAIMETMTVMSYLKKLDVKLGGQNGSSTLDKIAAALTEIIGKAEPASKPVIEVRKDKIAKGETKC